MTPEEKEVKIESYYPFRPDNKQGEMIDYRIYRDEEDDDEYNDMSYQGY